MSPRLSVVLMGAIAKEKLERFMRSNSAFVDAFQNFLFFLC